MPKQKGRKHDHKESAHCIIKRRTGVCEAYDEKKVYGSVYAACYVASMNEQKCEKIANAIAKKITKIVNKKKELSSEEISKYAIKQLKTYGKHAAFMYETHRDIS